MKELAEEIRKHKKLYYEGTPEITDEEFDGLVERLRELDPENEVLEEVGAPIESDKKIEHSRVMGSLAVINNEEGWLKWSKSSFLNETFIVEPKLDGLTIVLKYEKGNFYPAFLKKSSLINENYSVGIANGKHKIFFRQIAGILARRIINNLKPGEKVIKGKRFGMIKFGSRMDIIMPMSFKITVKLNQKVIGGETIIGVL